MLDRAVGVERFFDRGTARPTDRRTASTALLIISILGATASSLHAEERPLTTDGRLKRDTIVLKDGEEVIYVLQETPYLQRLMRLNVKDGTSVPVHPQASRSEFEPASTPDGRWLAYVQGRGNLSLALVLEDTTTGKTADIPPAGGFAGYRAPAWMPDGSRVIYSFADNGRQSLYSVDNQAKNRRTLVATAGINNFPAVSPDGKRLAFSTTRDGNFEIYVAGADGADPNRITDSPNQDLRPRWSPDGKRIAFTSNRDGNYELYVMQADGSSPVRITDHPERDDFPGWHPNGRQLVFVAERDGRHDLMLIDLP